MHDVKSLTWRCLWFFAIFLIQKSQANDVSFPTTTKRGPLRQHPPADTYTLALRKALVFFDAQKSGRLPKDNKVSWRGDSCVQDGAQGTYFSDLEGGYYDAGDAIKFHFPQAFAITMLSWSVVEYKAKYQAIGELSHVIDIIKWGTDYFLKTLPKSEFIQLLPIQVGSGDTFGQKGYPNDHKCWMRPEDINYDRPVSSCATCSDMASELAAAFAAASVVFKHDKPYAAKLVETAKKLYVFARSQRGRYSAGNEAEIFYNSSSYWDEFIWGGTWLYYATGNLSYLTLVTKPAMVVHAGVGLDYGIHSWDNKLPGAQVLLSRLKLFFNGGYAYGDLLSPFLKQTGIVMCSYLPDSKRFNRTKGGMIKLNYGRPMPLQFVVNAAFLAKLFSDYLEASNIEGWHCGTKYFSTSILRKFARDQMDYILGKNPMNMSYVVGFGDRYPQNVHHRGASIPRGESPVTCTGGYKWRDSKAPNPNIIVGAMVGGPDKNDGFQDVRAYYYYTEPTLAGNAGLVAALVALAGDGTAKIDKNATFLGYPPIFPII